MATVVVAAVVIGLVVRSTPATKLAVPNVVGLSQAQAVESLQGRGLDIAVGDVEHRFTHDAPGSVIGQDPPAGARVDDGTPARIVVSDGPQMATIPDLSQGDEAAARAAAEDVGLTIASVTQEFDEAVPPGQVLRQDPPAGGAVEVGTPINIVLSGGPAPRTVPNVTNATADEAKAALEGIQLALGQVTEEFHDTVPQGRVIRQDPPPAGQVGRGTPVNIVVSRGPQLVDVPNVAGRDPLTAADMIEEAGLRVGNAENFNRRAVVVRTSPAIGTPVRLGTVVNLVLGDD
jgi:serine/threonine-protein kinase